MSAHISADQSDDGWNVTVTGADSVTVRTSGDAVLIEVHPDEPEGKPLDVALVGTK